MYVPAKLQLFRCARLRLRVRESTSTAVLRCGSVAAPKLKRHAVRKTGVFGPGPDAAWRRA